MATIGYELGDTWEQVTNGNENAALQVKHGLIALCDSSGYPPDDSEYQEHAGDVGISPPVEAWVKAITPGKDGKPGYTKIVVIK